MYFDGVKGLIASHDALQSRASNATWVNEFIPVIEGSTKRFADVLLWLGLSGLCCAIVGEFAKYIRGKLASPTKFACYIRGIPREKFISVILLSRDGAS